MLLLHEHFIVTVTMMVIKKDFSQKRTLSILFVQYRKMPQPHRYLWLVLNALNYTWIG